ncbi:unnamed protein product, partial [Brenthis ino]
MFNPSEIQTSEGLCTKTHYILLPLYCLGGLVASTYGCRPGGPGSVVTWIVEFGSVAPPSLEGRRSCALTLIGHIEVSSHEL